MARCTVRGVHPKGFEVTVLVSDIEAIDDVIEVLLTRGYKPAASTGAWPTGPDGSPLCLKHGGVPMHKRSRQGDCWWSHKLRHPVTGEALYCRGVRYGPADKDGFLIDG